MRRRNEGGLCDNGDCCDRQNTQPHLEKGPCVAGRTFRRLIAGSEEQCQVNNESVTHVEEEIRSGFEIWDTFTPKVRWDGLGVRPFPI